MLQLTPQTRILLATEPVDFRKGIDGLAAVCRRALTEQPLSGTVFVFRNRAGTTLKLLCYDGQGFWLAQKRLSKGRFRYWPEGGTARTLETHQAQLLLAAGNPETKIAPVWKKIG